MGKKAKMKVVIMRGISGSGKSTFVKENFPDATVCSADHYFIDESGNYIFNKFKLGAAHKSCIEKYKEALKARVPLIVVDNTNTTLKEISPYVKAAKYHGYRVECVRIDTPVNVACHRNAHGVPYLAIAAMAARMAQVPAEWNERVIANAY